MQLDEIARLLNASLSLIGWALITLSAWLHWGVWPARLRLVAQGLAALLLACGYGSIEAYVQHAQGGWRTYFVTVALIWVVASQLLPDEKYWRRDDRRD